MTPAERIERGAAADFPRAAPASLAAAERIEVLELAGAVCTVVGARPELTVANRVTGLADAVADETLDTLESFFARHRARYTVAGDLPALARRGYTPDEPWALFERGVEPYRPAAPGLAVVDAGAARGREFGAVCGAASALPGFFSHWAAALAGRSGWHCFLAVDGETAVATGALYADGDAGWLGFGATLPERRRRGAQTVLLAARIERARELGLARLVTSTGAQPSSSYRNIERAGFRLAGLRPNWLSPA